MARAIDNGVYIVISGVGREKGSLMMPSRMINPSGEVIGEVDNDSMGVCVKDIDLNKRTYAYWLSVGLCNGEAHSIYLKERMR